MKLQRITCVHIYSTFQGNPKFKKQKSNHYSINFICNCRKNKILSIQNTLQKLNGMPYNWQKLPYKTENVNLFMYIANL